MTSRSRASRSQTPDFSGLEEFYLTQEQISALVGEGFVTTEEVLELTNEELKELGWNLKQRALFRRRTIQVVASPPATVTEPRSAPFPKGLPKYPSTYSSPKTFLEDFELVCDSEVYPAARRPMALVRSLVGCSHTWGKTNLLDANLSWPEVKVLFVQHFTTRYESHDIRAKLHQLRMEDKETILEYTDRYASLVHRLDENVDSAGNLYLLRKGLPPYLGLAYAAATALNEPTTFNHVVSILMNLESAPKRSVPSKQEVVEKVCAHHGVNKTHTTDQCRALQKKKKGNGSAPSKDSSSGSGSRQRTDAGAPSTTPSDDERKKGKGSPPTSSSGDSGSASGSRQRSGAGSMPSKPVTCFKCNKPGHYASKCPNNEEMDFFDVIEEILGEDSPAINMMDDDGGAPIKSTPTAQSPIMIPLRVNEVAVSALFDTGATHSAVSEDLHLQLQSKVIAVAGTLTGVTGTMNRMGKTQLTIRLNDGREFVHLFEIIPLHQSKVIVGRDLMTTLGISFEFPPCIASSSQDTNSSVVGDPLTFIDEPVIAKRIDDIHLAQLLRVVDPLVLENLNQPWFCIAQDCELQLRTGDAVPHYIRQYVVADKLKPLVNKKIEELLARGIIRKVSQAVKWNSPLLCAPKKDREGKWTDVRMCLDTRTLNKVVEPECYKTQTIGELFHKIKGFQVASLIDLAEGFHQIPIREQDQEKTSFQWENNRYCWVGTPYGLMNMPGHFQRVMMTLLQDHLEYVIVYIDDILIFSKSIEQHVEHVRQVICTLTRSHLRISETKSKFGYTTISLLGYLCSGDTLSIAPEKLSVFQQIEPPKTGKDMERFLGVVNYLREYIPMYAKLCAPFESLRKAKVISWSPEMLHHMKVLRGVLSKPPVLSQPVEGVEYRIGTDASQGGVGAVLFQEVDGKRRFISFQAKALNSGQRNYSATKRECLAIVFALSKFRQYVYGTHFTLYTDHRALCFLLTNEHESPMLSSWADQLLGYDMKVIHKPGITMILEDALSRLYFELEHGEQVDVLTTTVGPARELKQFIEECLNKECPEEDKRAYLIDQCHIEGGHHGARLMFKALFREGYYWNGMLRDCKARAENCAQCLQYNIQHDGYHPLQPMVTSFPMERLHVDLAGPFPTSTNGYNYVLVMVCSFTRYCVLVNLYSKMADEVAVAMVTTFSTLGKPSVLYSDNGSEFRNQIQDAIAKMLEFYHQYATPYNPRTNGTAERMVKSFKTILKKMCQGDFSEWDRAIPFIQAQLNQRTSSRHGSSPFALMYGRQSNWSVANSPESDEEDEAQLEQWKTQLKTLTTQVYPVIKLKSQLSSSKMKNHFDSSNKLVRFLTNGTRVMVLQTEKSDKLKPAYAGPYTVVGRHGSSYQLIDATGALVKSRTPIQHLKVIDMPNEEEVYEVDRIIAHRGKGKKREYLVRWKNYSSEEDSWEPASHFNDNSTIQKYIQSQGKSSGRG